MNSSFFEGGPKTLFYTGLFLGIAATLLIGMAVMLSGEFSPASATGTGNRVANPSPTPTQPTQPSQPTQPAGPVADFNPDEDHWIGAEDATVTLIEYSDFECPFCQRHEPSLQQALEEFPNDVRLVYRHYPLTAIHPSAQKAAEASECVASIAGNDAFWEYHDRLFEAQDSGLSVSLFKQIAGEMGVNQGEFDECLDSGEMAPKVAEDVATGNDAGVQGTPATFVNGSMVSGAVPYSTLKSAIEAAGASS